jgi:hypothetical protein
MMTEAEAVKSWEHLIWRYGLRWGPEVPRSAYELVTEIRRSIPESKIREITRRFLLFPK